jgi:hypothetical protein
MRPEERQPALRLVTSPEPEPIARSDDAVPPPDAEQATRILIDATTTEAWRRVSWSMRLHALLGAEVGRAAGEGILTHAQADVLLAQLALVIDQAVGAADD